MTNHKSRYENAPRKRYSWEKELTICIAAPCIDVERGICIVLCSDWRRSTGLGTSDTALKLRPLADDWYCLSAGGISEIESMFRLLKRRFGKLDPVVDHDISAVVRGVVKQRKHALADTYTISKYALSYDDFVDRGREKLPPEEFREAFRQIGSIRLGAEFIVAGFPDSSTAEICMIDSTGEPSLHDDFIAIGNAQHLASASLFRRHQNAMLGLAPTTYHVYEAKRDAERMASVSRETDIVVIAPGKKFEPTWSKGQKAMDKIYKKHHRVVLDREIQSFSGILYRRSIAGGE